jgi:hypothetical protein
MTDTDRLAALIAAQLPRHHILDVVEEPVEGTDTFRRTPFTTYLAARLIAAGVTLAPTPPDALREAARAFVDVWGETEAMESSHTFVRLREALAQPKEADRGE